MTNLDRRETKKSLSGRVFLGFCGVFAVFLALAGRLFFLQIVNQKKYALLSDRNRIHTVYSLAPRGRILDRTGCVLAGSRTEYQAVVDLAQFRNSPEKWQIICKTLKLDPSIPLSVYRQKHTKAVGPSSVIPLKNSLSWDEIRALEELATHIPGILVMPRLLRTYPLGSVMSHIVGYVTAPQEKDLKENANLKVLGSVLGVTGLEKTADFQLQGIPGFKQFEINANRRVVRILEESKPVPGKDVQLTIHAGLQKRVMEIMKDVRCGVGMVMDIRTGELLASVSLPTFDSNDFIEGIASSVWKELSGHKDSPLLHRAVSGLYAPGSTFKMMVALAALESGVITEATSFFCPGYMAIGERKIYCWRWRTGGHGGLNVVQALAQSCDVFFFNVVARLSMSEIVHTAQNFGFGTKTLVGLPGERSGTLPTAPQVWRKQDLGAAMNLSIGQGNLTATPLQLLTMTARLASGRKVVPRVLQTEIQSFEPLPVSPSSLDIIRRSMEKTVWSPLGTAQNAQSSGLRLAGKTGSTQVCRITAEERRRGQLSKRPYELRDHALFVGYAPVTSPRFAVVVVVEHGESGGRVAAPLGRDILLAAHELCGEEPK